VIILIYLSNCCCISRSIGLGNGHKKSKRFEQFVMSERRTLREEANLCERATQKILLYSNNFLHKKLKTDSVRIRAIVNILLNSVY